MATAASRSMILVRRSSPYFAASSVISLPTSLRSFALALEDRIELVALRGQLLLLLADLHLFELGQVAQLGLEDELRLFLGQLEALHEDGLGLVLAANDADHLVEVQINRDQAFEDVQAPIDLVEAVLQPARDGSRCGNSSQLERISLRPMTFGRPSRPMMFRLTR